MSRIMLLASEKRWPYSAGWICAAAIAASLLIFSPGRAATATGADAKAAVAGAPSSGQPDEYRIGPLDKLDITVFLAKDLDLKEAQVDASGKILLPLIGLVEAQGKTATELSAEIAARLDANYMQNAQVSVVVHESATQKVTVGGAVTNAGVFQLQGSTTLLAAIAMAKGPSKTADLSHVTVFRATDAGARERLRFNAIAIEKGREIDPPIFRNDVVMVSESGAKNTFENLIIPLTPFIELLALIH